ncbi:hypothetical protein BYT27DRAFT_7194418 [Phlegmacium glaucopus]|nr:hypothetical protein BYT27DRAFT_7194418 [Phlegmacium glaucopus]
MFHTSAPGETRLIARMPFNPTTMTMFGSVGEKTTDDQALNDEVTAPVAVSQKSNLPLLQPVVPAIAVPSDEKGREAWHDPMNQLLGFVSTKTYLEEFAMIQERTRELLRSNEDD